MPSEDSPGSGRSDVSETITDTIPETTAPSLPTLAPSSYVSQAQTQASLSTVLVSIGDAVLVTDAQGAVTLLNPATEQLTGWTTAEALGVDSKIVFDIVNEETRSVVESPINRVLRENTTVCLANHTILRRRDGSEIYIHDSSAAVRDEHGKLTNVVLVFRDITQRTAERAAHDALSYSQSIVDTVREPLLILDRDLRVVSASRSFYETFQVTADETQGALVYDLGNQQWNLPALRTLLEDIVPQNVVMTDFRVEHTFPQIGPRVMLLNARKLYHPGHQAEMLLLAIEDITARDQAEQERQKAAAALKESEKRFRLLVEGATNFAMFLIDKDGRIASWNEGARRILGYEEAEVLGQPVSLIFTPEDCANGIPERELTTALRDGRAADVRWHQRKDGSRVWVDGIMERLTNETGALEGFAKLLRDATEANQAEATLRASRDAVEASEAQLRNAQSRLEAALSAGEIATCTLDVLNRRVIGDATLARFFWVEPEDVAGGDFDKFLNAIHVDDRCHAIQAVADALAGSNDYADEYRVVSPDGTSLRWLYTRAKIERDTTGTPLTMTGAVTDVTAVRQAQERQQFLSELTERLRRQNDPTTVITETLSAVGNFLGLSRYLYADVDDAAEIITVHRDWVAPQQGVLSVAGTWDFSAWTRDIAPLGTTHAALRSGRISVIPDFATDPRTSEEFATTLPHAVRGRMRAAVRIPLYRDGQWVALLSAQSLVPRDWTAEETALLETVAERTWLTLENLRLLREAQAQAREQRARAERAVVLNKISAAVRQTTEPNTILERAVTLLGQGLRADRCYFVRNDLIRNVARVFPEWRREGAGVETLTGRTFTISEYAINQDSAYRAGRTHVLNDVMTEAGEDAASLLSLQVRSILRVPVRVGERGEGLSVMMTQEPRVWTEGEIRLVENVAALVRSALEAAHLQQRERNIAQQLQEALIPPPPRDVSGMALASFYRPALAEASVGGDFFDVFPLKSGYTALIVADLSGKGLKAASQVATVRNMLRYALYSTPVLADAVTGLHRSLVQYDLLTGFATLFVGIYDAPQATLTYVNAGQEPGLIWRTATGAVDLLSPTGPVLGGFGDGDYEERTVTLSHGDVLTLFTDGLTEVGPNRKEQLDVEGVSDVLRGCCDTTSAEPFSPQSIVDRLIAGVDAFARGGVRDDIAVLVGVVGAAETTHAPRMATR